MLKIRGCGDLELRRMGSLQWRSHGRLVPRAGCSHGRKSVVPSCFLGPASQVGAGDRFVFGNTGPRLASEVHGPTAGAFRFNGEAMAGCSHGRESVVTSSVEASVAKRRQELLCVWEQK